MVYLIAVALSLFYMANCPLFLRVEADGMHALRIRIGVFVPVWMSLSSGRHRQRKAGLKATQLRPLLQCAWQLLRHVRLEHLRADGEFSTGDAMTTAISAALINLILAGISSDCGSGQIVACYGDARWNVQISGIASVRAGHIISAAAGLAAHLIGRRIKNGQTSD